MAFGTSFRAVILVFFFVMIGVSRTTCSDDFEDAVEVTERFLTTSAWRGFEADG